MPVLRPRTPKPITKPVSSSGVRSSSRIVTPTDRLSPVVFARVSYN